MFGRSFVSFLGSLIGLGEEAPGSRSVHWPFRTAGFGYEFRGWAAAGLFVRTAAWKTICIARAEPLPATRLAAGTQYRRAGGADS